MFFKSVECVSLVAATVVCGFFVQQTQTPTAQQASHSPVEKNWAQRDPSGVLGYESCRKCHLLQIQTLQTTKHYTSYESMHRLPQAKQFCRALGIRSVKRSERCVRCHYTPEVSSKGRVKAQSGISCESCHGPAKNWVQGHNDYGGLTITKETETKQHKAWRVKNSIESGMRHPSNLYLLARSCYDCHLVDDAELVNVTGHPAASSDFNMVAWSQGSMRHNWHRSDGRTNEPSSPQRLRVMYVVDLLARLEYSLRARANSQPGSRHYMEVEKQMKSAIAKLREVKKLARLTKEDSVTRVLTEWDALSAEASSESRLRLANTIRELAFGFAENENIHMLDAIQPVLPSPSSYR